MTFLFPLGLLGLIGVPILILIYIIKSKYAEQTVASTYLWRLSERFLKRKRPVSPLAGLVSLLLQILTVVVISLLVAHPILTVKNAAYEYCFLLDASGSMQMTEGGVTRYERAKEAIAEKIRQATTGSRYSLITVSDVTTTAFEKVADKEQALELLSTLSGGYAEADWGEAIATAQSYFNENSSLRTYLVTDTDYADVQNIEVINVAGNEQNVAISGVNWVIREGELTVTGKLQAWGTAPTLTVSAYADGGAAPIATVDVTTTDGALADFTLKAALKTFTGLRLSITAADGLLLDNEYVIHNIKSEDTYSILIVSDRPYFLQSALNAVGHTALTVLTPAQFHAGVRGYGLYVFDCCVPAQMPEDGAVWFFNPPASVPDAGFSVQGEVSFSVGEPIEKTDATSSLATTLTAGLSDREILISEYVKCSPYRSFTTLFSYEGMPLVFAGTNGLGHREVVFAFDLHRSNLPVLVDYIILMENLMTYSFPDVVEKVNYYAGDEATVNVLTNCESIRVDSPLGSVLYLDLGNAAAGFTLTEVGTYDITVTVSGIPRTFHMYSSLPETERLPHPAAASIGLQGEAGNESFDGTFDPLMILFVCLALLFLADWMVYCYEKYQLR